MTLHRQTVLIVDDLPDNLEVIASLLRPDYDIATAASGAEGLRLAHALPPDLILLDVMLPDMDGYEVMRRLAAADETRGIPVIFLTVLDAPDEVVRGLELGAVDYIAQPVQPAVLRARVRVQLEARRMRDWLRDQNEFLEKEVVRRMTEAERIRNEAEKLQQHLNRQRDLILETAAEGIFGVDIQGRISFVNAAAASFLGYQANDLHGRLACDLLYEVNQRTKCPLHAAFKTGVELREHEEVFRHHDGQPVSLEVFSKPIYEEGALQGAVVTLQDHSERKRYLEQIERKSNYDDLTGLPNRNLLNDRLAHALERARRSGSLVAVMSIDVDRFKSVNDSLGHSAGDQVLHNIAVRLGERVRKMDTLARLDGDEFVLVAETADTETIDKMAQQLLDQMQAPYHVGEHEFFLSSSIGIAIFPKDGDDGEILLKNAMAAMYYAKGNGGSRMHFYSADINARSLERLNLENGLRRAIERNELVLHYQPQVSLRTGEIIGAEALVRWQHPERGLVMPGDFIGIAEDCGLIVPLGEWVLNEACACNKAWQDAGLTAITMAVNLSARQFAAQDVVRLAASIIERTGLDPQYLELELTESAVMADAEAFIHATEQLKGLAITLSIDDFGTGFSSLNYLRRFAIDRLKIDQSFVRDITHDANSAAIALAVISLAHSLKLSAIAEGVETEAQLAFLRRRDCDEMQGFLFSKPVPAKEFEQMLRDRRKLEFSTEAALPTRTLLLVDDEASILASLKRLFRREGYRILTAEGGLAALELLASNDVGVVLTDARMPGMTGGELLGKVREMYPDIVRLMLSGYTDLKAVTAAVNTGELFAFLTKPWDDKELLETVRNAFRQHELRRAGSVEGARLP